MPLAFSSGVPCPVGQAGIGYILPSPGIVFAHLLLSWGQCSRQAGVICEHSDHAPPPTPPAGAGDVHPGFAAVPQGERRQMEATVPADRRRHPPDVSQAAGLSPSASFYGVSGAPS